MKHDAMKFRISVAALAAVLVGASGLVVASGHEEAKALRDAGEIVSLEAVLADAKQEHNGRVLEAELEHEHGQYVYEVELLDKNGRVRELVYDAQSGELLKSRYDD